MAAFLAPIGNGVTFFTSQGVVLSGGKIATYLAGTTTPVATFTDSTQITQNPNPIILGSNGISPQEIWLSSGVRYKFVISDSNNNILATYDNLSGINDVTTGVSQWIASGVAPTYISATSFSLPGDQTANFTQYRRIQAFVNSGIVYGTILSSIFSGGVTTVTVVMDSLPLDNGLSSVNLSFLTSTNQSIPGNLSITTLTISGISSVPTSNVIAGLNLSTAGSSATMSISTGQASDSTSTNSLILAAAINKTTSTWAVGSNNGGIDTGTIANNSWYYFYLIKRLDTGIVDVIFSLSSTSPALPTNYTIYRYIGAGLTNGSAQWTAFTQVGDEFFWSTPFLDFNGSGSATAALLTCSAPRGRKMKIFFNAYVNNGANGIYISDPANANLAPDAGAVNPLSSIQAGSGSVSAQISCWSNTSAQIRHREINTGVVAIATLGWIDKRDRI